MRTAVVSRGTGGDRIVAGAAALAVGCGLGLALAGAVAGRLPWLAGGGAAVAGGLVILLAGGWLDGILLLALSVPLPALAAGDGLRLAAAAPVAALVLAGWVLGFALPRRRLDPGHLPVRSTVLLVTAWILAGVLAAAPLVAARETLNLLVLLGVLVAAVDTFRRRPGAREQVVTAVSAVAAVCGGLAVLESVGVLPGRFPRTGTALNRAALGFGQPNGLGLFLALAVPLLVHRVTTAEGRSRVLWRGALVVTSGGLVATFSRGSWLAVLAGAAVLALVGAGRRVLLVWLGALLVAAVADLVSGGAIRDTVARTVGDWVIEQRAALALTGIVMFLAHPVVGVGPGGFAVGLDEYGALVPGLQDLKPTPHNAYIQAAAETGALGLATFLLFVVASGVVLVRLARRAASPPSCSPREVSLRRAVLWSMATVAAAGMVIWPLAHGYGEAVVLILAVGLSAGGGDRRTSPPGAP